MTTLLPARAFFFLAECGITRQVAAPETNPERPRDVSR